MTGTSIKLSDTDLATLINSTDADVRTAAEGAVARLAAPAQWPDVPAHVTKLIANVLREAKKHRRLIHRFERISYCSYCGAHSEWKRLKRRRHKSEIMLDGYEFAYRFVTIKNFVSVGACGTCVEQALPILKAELAKLKVELPPSLQLDGEPTHRRWDKCRCKKCGWEGHEGQLGKLPAIISGYYRGKCPSCGVERSPLGANPFETLEGFEVVEEVANG